MGKKLKLEKWTCDNTEEEVHFFLGERYVLGYNPKLIPPEVVRVMLVVMGYEIPE